MPKSLLCTIGFLSKSLQMHVYAGGRKKANNAACIEAYMIRNTTVTLPSRDLGSSTSIRASHQYQTGYPDDMRVMIWMW